MIHFPDKFYKGVTPKSYFWQVLAIKKPNDYEKLLSSARDRIINCRRLTRNNIIMTDEALSIFDKFTDESLNLLGKLTSHKR